MNKKEIRQEKILSYIKKHREVSMEKLEEYVQCSYPTLCRDLLALEEDCKIQRMHGYVRDISQSANAMLTRNPCSPDYNLHQARMQINTSEKIAIGKAAASLLRANDVVYITHGTSTERLAEAIDVNLPLTVITDGLDIMQALENHSNIKVYSTGGSINYQSRQIEHMPFLSCEIKKLHINKMIMGIGGISLEAGITFYDFTSCKFISEIIDTVKEVIVLADYSKLNYVTFASCIPLKDIDTLVTDWNADMEFIRSLEEQGIRCIISDSPL